MTQIGMGRRTFIAAGIAAGIATWLRIAIPRRSGRGLGLVRAATRQRRGERESECEGAAAHALPSTAMRWHALLR